MRTVRRRLRRVLIFAGAAALAAAAAFGLLLVLFPFPERLLAPPPGSPVVLDRAGRPLLVLTASDGRWRLPLSLDAAGPWLVPATLAAEDGRFFSHPGVDPAAVLRAAGQNLLGGRVVSGASTLTMQLVGLVEPRPRSLRGKAVEAFRAIELELVRDKDFILSRYLTVAPCGGNVEGAAAASLLYFGKPPADLSLAEAALLAGLPQAPARLRPDVHPEAAARRRAVVLSRMEEAGAITTEMRAAAEAAPVAAAALREAGSRLSADAGRHAAFLALSRRPGGGRTTIDLPLSRAVEGLAAAHIAALPPGTDVAVVVIDVAAAEIRALAGSADFDDPADGQVNGATALRSPGSALKPFLYAAAFETGRLAPDSPVPDRPVERDGWRPRNFDGAFAGEVTAAEALRRSLNVPALLVTEAVGLPRAVNVLRAAGLPLPPDAEDRGGLAVATGAVEVRLLDLTNAYATLARGGVRRPARLFPDEAAPEARVLSPAVCAIIDAILSCRARVPAGLADRPEDAVRWFMWKTGTSSGRRDAFAVGHNRRYAVGVWVGRFSGAGDAAYTGREAAEPLLARLFQHPLLAAESDPPPAPPLAAAHPFFAAGAAPPGGPEIRRPADGAVYLSAGGEARIAVEASPAAGLRWFLNGDLLAGAPGPALTLPPGRHELRAVDAAGRAAAAAFTVR